MSFIVQMARYNLGMAKREMLSVIRNARAGDQHAQVELARVYLVGESGLAPSLPSALLWLERAARQGCAAAVKLIGEHIPLEIVRQASGSNAFLMQCYYTAGLAGCRAARWAFAQWKLDAANGQPPADDNEYATAAAWLEQLANDGYHGASWQLSRCLQDGRIPPRHASDALRYARQAADAGDEAALRWVATSLPSRGPAQANPQHLRSLVGTLVHRHTLTPTDARLLLMFFQDEKRSVLEPSDLALTALDRAAHAGLADAQHAFGLWLGRLDDTGQRLPLSRDTGVPKLKKAMFWLQRAADQRFAPAWYVLSSLYRNPKFSGYNLEQASHCLEQAARLGYPMGQLTLGKRLWRGRKLDFSREVEASYWTWRAAQAGLAEAQELMPRMIDRAPPADNSPWRPLATFVQRTAMRGTLALLAQRIMLAQGFGLDKAEMLLIDPASAQREHCLVVDISRERPRRRPRLIMIESMQQRKLLLQAANAFNENPIARELEGTYRNRRYRLARLIDEAARSGVHTYLD
jgi:TPR repeat protein